MADEGDPQLLSPDPSTRAWALVKRGISRVDSGEHDAAMSDFLEAERIAEQAGLSDLVSVSRLNQGHAFSVKGDAGSAARLFEQAADLTRERGDTERLALALSNLSVVLKQQGLHADAIAVLTEYLDLPGSRDAAARGHAYVERATSLIEQGGYEQAAADLAQADDIATKADDRSLRYVVRTSRANIYLRMGDVDAARIVLEQALDLARSSGDPFELQGALFSLAQVYRLSGLRQQADSLFAEVEQMFRARNETTALADALYWHGVLLGSMGRRQSALSLWREEEAIRREGGQTGHVAECLYAQADALRREGDHDAADRAFREAAELFEGLNMTGLLASALYDHGMSLREAGRSAEALTRADEALAEAVSSRDSIVERRAQSLRAMALADLGEIGAAHEALDAAERLCEQTDAQSAKVWVLSRRAYVIACDGGEPQEVVEHLKQAHQYALTCEKLATGRSAVRKIAAEINAHCDASYAEPLEVFRAEQLEEINRAVTTGMPPIVTAPPVNPAAPDIPPADDDDLESPFEEE